MLDIQWRDLARWDYPSVLITLDNICSWMSRGYCVSYTIPFTYHSGLTCLEGWYDSLTDGESQTLISFKSCNGWHMLDYPFTKLCISISCTHSLTCTRYIKWGGVLKHAHDMVPYADAYIPYWSYLLYNMTLVLLSHSLLYLEVSSHVTCSFIFIRTSESLQ
jgi:hypothetical protein